MSLLLSESCHTKFHFIVHNNNKVLTEKSFLSSPETGKGQDYMKDDSGCFRTNPQ